MIAPSLATYRRRDAAVDNSIMATVRLVTSMHPGNPSDSATDSVATYGWIREQAAPDLSTGLRIYPTPTQAARWLHDLRATENRDLPCATCGPDGAIDTWPSAA